MILILRTQLNQKMTPVMKVSQTMIQTMISVRKILKTQKNQMMTMMSMTGKNSQRIQRSR